MTVLSQRLLFELGVQDLPGELTPRYNIAPTQLIAAVREGADGCRRLGMLRWGLIPSWAKDPSIGARMINARAETIAEKPAFRAAFRRQRCLVLADGYYEWKKAGKKKLPYHIRMRDESPFAFAGLWDRWSPGGDGEFVESCSLITTGANAATCDIHDRMPVILPPEAYSLWLNPKVNDAAALTPLLCGYDPEEMIAVPVSTYVNNARNEGQECLQVAE
jgi:putative SOS response-associated peptidase YedK